MVETDAEKFARRAALMKTPRTTRGMTAKKAECSAQGKVFGRSRKGTMFCKNKPSSWKGRKKIGCKTKGGNCRYTAVGLRHKAKKAGIRVTTTSSTGHTKYKTKAELRQALGM
jgi:hypothetical protein